MEKKLKKAIKAWAVITKGIPLQFSEIFYTKKAANEYGRELLGGIKVVPITIHL